MKYLLSMIAAFAVAGFSPAALALNVFACEPEWASLAKEIGGDKVEITTATTAFQDPHHIQARPSLIAAVRRADLVICTGSGLEAGWLPALLQRANNSSTRPGQPGHFLAAEHVSLKGIPDVVDRAHGDVHPEGNPHFHLDPDNIRKVARSLTGRMGVLEPENAELFKTRALDFMKRWKTATEQWEATAAPLMGMRTVAHHSTWLYLNDWLGLEELGQLEPLPGVQPSVSHLQGLLDSFGDKPPAVILRTPYLDDRASDWLARKTGAAALELPSTVGGADGADDLFGLFDVIIQRLLKHGTP